MLRVERTPAFERDVKRLNRKHAKLDDLKEVMRLVAENTVETLEVLRQRHNMHTLSGKWQGNNECHVCNAGDWLLIWTVVGDLAIFQRTGSHDELFR